MRYAWDAFRWRFVAAFYIAWWACKGMPRVFGHMSRWDIAVSSWRHNRANIMAKHWQHKLVSARKFFEDWESK